MHSRIIHVWIIVIFTFFLSSASGESMFIRGDVNQDASINLADAISLLGYICSTSDAPGCMDSADCNDDGAIDLADAITLLGSIFNSDILPEPVDKFDFDFTDDSLTCDVFLPSLLSSDDLIADYRFNGNAIDDSVYCNDGTVNGAVLVNDRHGNMNSAYEFDGIDDYLDVPDSTSLNPSYVTVSAWIKIDSFDRLLDNAQVIAKAHSYNLQLFNSKTIHANPESIRFVPFSMVPDEVPPDTGPNNIITGKWHHVVGTYDGTMASIYLDGNLKESLAFEASIPHPGDNLGMGIDLRGSTPNTWDGNWFKGYLDDVRIFNRALKAKEISTLYEIEKP